MGGRLGETACDLRLPMDTLVLIALVGVATVSLCLERWLRGLRGLLGLSPLSGWWLSGVLFACSLGLASWSRRDMDTVLPGVTRRCGVEARELECSRASIPGVMVGMRSVRRRCADMQKDWLITFSSPRSIFSHEYGAVINRLILGTKK